MIKISLDEAFVFDMLSIHDIKRQKLKDDKSILTNKKFNDLCLEISSQIGHDKFSDILNSIEYKKMCEANSKVFELVDLCKTDNGLAKMTDDANYERFLRKIDLQNKFFDQKISEVKSRDS